MNQGSDEWIKARLGKVTASRIGDVMARTKNGYGASRANYLAELIAERLTGAPADKFVSPAMQWGTDTEADARIAYEFYSGSAVVPVGFVVHPTIAESGASPDGLVGDVGLIEIKCPNTATHIETLRGRAAPAKYRDQMQWQMACTGRAWCDFASFDPRMPEQLRLFVRRVPRDDARIAEISDEVTWFLGELAGAVKELTAMMREAA